MGRAPRATGSLLGMLVAAAVVLVAIAGHGSAALGSLGPSPAVAQSTVTTVEGSAVNPVTVARHLAGPAQPDLSPETWFEPTLAVLAAMTTLLGLLALAVSDRTPRRAVVGLAGRSNASRAPPVAHLS